MISLYSGTPGSYKSYHAVAECIDWLRLGRNLITNFPLNYSGVLKRGIRGDYQFLFDDDITVPFLLDYAREHHHKGVKAQTLVVIDEASLKFNPREFGRKDRLEWINFFANHRHFNYDFILITQNDRMLDRQIRGLIETEYKHRSLKNYKTFGFLLNAVCHGCFMCVEYWYPCKLRCGSQFKLFHKKIANCYDTMALFVGDKKAVKKDNEVNSFNTDEQVRQNLTQLVTLLNAYVLRNQ